MRFGLDYSDSSMSAGSIHGVGADFICRYVSRPGEPKNIDREEALAMSRAGIDIVLVFETTADRAQTYAWSGGNWDPRAQLQQFSNSHHVGVECDYDHGVGQDFGQWRIDHLPPPPPNPHLPLAVDGVLGGRTIAAMQWAMSIPDDGVFGDQTKRALQRRVGVQQDGVIGSETVTALQRHVRAQVDGVWGPETTRCLQQSLNSDRF
jgi:hypothetical protein